MSRPGEIHHLPGWLVTFRPLLFFAEVPITQPLATTKSKGCHVPFFVVYAEVPITKPNRQPPMQVRRTQRITTVLLYLACLMWWLLLWWLCWSTKLLLINCFSMSCRQRVNPGYRVNPGFCCHFRCCLRQGKCRGRREGYRALRGCGASHQDA